MSTENTTPTITVAEIQSRGRDLQKRFRNAGIPQYTRWMVDQRPAMASEPTIVERIRKVFNGEGARRDTALLILCEELADKYLSNQQAAA